MSNKQLKGLHIKTNKDAENPHPYRDVSGQTKLSFLHCTVQQWRRPWFPDLWTLLIPAVTWILIWVFLNLWPLRRFLPVPGHLQWWIMLNSKCLKAAGAFWSNLNDILVVSDFLQMSPVCFGDLSVSYLLKGFTKKEQVWQSGSGSGSGASFGARHLFTQGHVRLTTDEVCIIWPKRTISRF